MRSLHHFILCPFSRKVRILLNEKELDCELVSEEFWEKKSKFLILNPVGQVPVLVDEGTAIIDSSAICEFLEEKYGISGLLGKTYTDKAVVRGLMAIFDQKMFHDVVKYILSERLIKYLSTSEAPNSSLIRIAKNNLIEYLNYMRRLLLKSQWLMGDIFTLADIAAASHISILDYFGDMPWNYDNVVKEWYSVIKSKPSFRNILKDRIAGFTPNGIYEKLDF
ncbi:FtsZ-localized protein A [Candidatus Xenohaliotis californiensis]|uniref:FtsZ-localized protein A n=1 Tax=Candidatus Xenohaliotis californiensis TaxID=84677 RepID=A0ABM9N806_9RICK|nr:FtsZ-localized protein A [Candidatus Xenohaliotis californiensis]